MSEDLKERIDARVKELVRPPKMARFSHYMDATLYYVTDDGFEIPISAEEAKGGVFYAEFKAIRLMRWIRKKVEMLEKEAQGA